MSSITERSPTRRWTLSLCWVPLLHTSPPTRSRQNMFYPQSQMTLDPIHNNTRTHEGQTTIQTHVPHKISYTTDTRNKRGGVGVHSGGVDVGVHVLNSVSFQWVQPTCCTRPRSVCASLCTRKSVYMRILVVLCGFSAGAITCVCVGIFVCVRLYMWVWVLANLRDYVCVRVWMHTPVCVCLCMCVCECVRMVMCPRLFACTCVITCAWVHLCGCVWMCACGVYVW